MLKLPKFTAVALLVGAVCAVSACKDEKKAENAAQQPAAQTQPAQANDDLKDPSYAVGALIGTDLKGLVDAQKDVITYNQEKLLSGVKDALAGKIDLKNEELGNTLKSIDEKLKVASQEKAAKAAQQAKEAGEKFVAEFAKKEGVKKTDDGLLYRIENEGEGAAIKPTDVVKVHYTGTLPDGTVFDSSRDNDTPAEFKLDQVIPGWVEGLQLIKKGGKIELVIPPSLAYGDQDVGQIPANSTLHFDVEVLDVNPSKSK
ncbi:FKBP-type peptidyl-prolyl cis-trans isomerase [Pasteurellaceae bacterium LIM206]|nr:FKBP-type peptidyl-prolyl cis-trans isomerase [Pasteurellaceae bacterium LIM206]